jgi:hypothetical protein
MIPKKTEFWGIRLAEMGLLETENAAPCTSAAFRWQISGERYLFAEVES